MSARPKIQTITQASGTEEIVVEISGGTRVVIDKLFGPLIACKVRAWLDTAKGEWVFERECIRTRHTVPMAGGDGLLSYDEGDAIFWEEVHRLDCQASIDFDEEDGA